MYMFLHEILVQNAASSHVIGKLDYNYRIELVYSNYSRYYSVHARPAWCEFIPN